MCPVISLLALLPVGLPPGAQPGADLKALQGEWVLVAESLGGPIRPPQGSYTVTFEGSRSTVRAGTEVTARWEVTLDPTANPKRLDAKDGDKSLVEIYRLDGDTLTVAFRNHWNDPRRPTDFEPRDGIGIYVAAADRGGV
jgi:uncharacterized protein (TIGR03067 family)